MDNIVDTRDPIFNEYAPLDNILIAHMLGSFIKVNPTSKPLTLPSFRLTQLCERCSQSNSFHGDANTIETIGCIFVISLNYSVSAHFDPAAVYQCAALLSTVFSECIAVMHLKEKNLDILHPNYVFDQSTLPLSEIFNKCFELEKEILRDVVRQVRSCRDKRKDQAKANSFSHETKPKGKEEPTDCFQPHSLYLFVSLALGHMCCVLQTMNNMNAIPGVVESVISMALFTPVITPKEKKRITLKKQNEELSEQQQEMELKLRKEEKENNFLKIIECVNALGKDIMLNCFDEKSLLELRIIKSKATKKVTHQDVTYASAKSSLVKDFLHKFDTEMKRDLKLGVMNLASTSDGALNISSVPRLEFNKLIDPLIGLPVNLIKNPDLKMISSSIETLEKFEKSLRKPGQKNHDPEDFKEIEYLWQRIAKHFAKSFLVTRALRRPTSIRHIYPSSYRPKASNYMQRKVVRSLPSDFLMSDNIDDIEIAYFNGDQFYCPRITDPTHIMYWIVFQMVDYLLEKTIAKEGFKVDSIALRRRMKEKVDHMTDSRVTGEVTVKLDDVKDVAKKNGAKVTEEKSPKVKSTNPLESTTIPAILPSPSSLFQQPPTIPSTTLLKSSKPIPKLNDELVVTAPVKATGKVGKKKLDLLDRLNLAQEEAKLEQSLLDIERKVKESRIAEVKDKKLKAVEKAVRHGYKVLEKYALYETKRQNLKPIIRQGHYWDENIDTKSSQNSAMLSPLPRIMMKVDEEDSEQEEENRVDNKSTEDYSEDTKTINDKHDTDNNDNEEDGDNEDEGSGDEDVDDEDDEDGDEDRDEDGDDGDNEDEGETALSDEYAETEDEQPIRANSEAVISEEDTIDPKLRLNKDPLMQEVNQFRLKVREAGLIDIKTETKVVTYDKTTPSNVWKSKGNVDHMLGFKRRRPRNAAEAAKEYVDEILKYKNEKRLEELKLKNELQDEQEMQLGRIRTIKLAIANEKRERQREAVREGSILKAKFIEEQRKLDQKEKAKRKKEALVRAEREAAERQRIAEIKYLASTENKGDEVLMKELKIQEAIRISKLSNEKEVHEIVRRNFEEDRMRFLEGRRKLVEDRDINAAKRQLDEINTKRKSFHESKEKMTYKLRMGNFLWHNGKYSFYSDVRKDIIPWEELMDDNGEFYYYDPITKRSQRNKPSDAPINGYYDKIRNDYDAIHGKGKYEAMVLDKAHKDAINANGGWYNDDGDWVEAFGYFDENYEWVPYEGYFDDDGKYIRYAKVSGDLSFMV